MELAEEYLNFETLYVRWQLTMIKSVGVCNKQFSMDFWQEDKDIRSCHSQILYGQKQMTYKF